MLAFKALAFKTKLYTRVALKPPLLRRFMNTPASTNIKLLTETAISKTSNSHLTYNITKVIVENSFRIVSENTCAYCTTFRSSSCVAADACAAQRVPVTSYDSETTRAD